MFRKLILRALAGAVLIGLGVAAFATRDFWQPLLDSQANTAEAEPEPVPIEEAKVLKLTPQARKNLKLVSKPVSLQSYWRTVQIPGVIVDRPGLTDRGITSPAVGAVTEVHAFAGDTVAPGQKLFTLRLFSEYLHNTQSELFKATRETLLIQEERDRIAALASSGTIAGSRIIELDQRIRRQAGLIQSYRQDLLTRGLTPEQIGQIAEGNFVFTIDVVVPPPPENVPQTPTYQPVAFVNDHGKTRSASYEVQELKVDLG